MIPGRPALSAVLALAALGGFRTPDAQDSPQKLSPALEVLRPFLGGWTGEFQPADERPEILRTFTSILGGHAVKETRIVADMGFEAESTFYFDGRSGRVAYVGITNNGYSSRGTIVFDGEVFVQEGEQSRPDGSTGAIRVTFRFREDGTILNQLFNLEDGAWTEGHTVLYSPREGSARGSLVFSF